MAEQKSSMTPYTVPSQVFIMGGNQLAKLMVYGESQKTFLLAVICAYHLAGAALRAHGEAHSMTILREMNTNIGNFARD